MARRVPVVLELLAGQYLAQARLAEQQTAKLDREMGQLDRSIKEVDFKLAELTVSAKAASTQVDNLGDQARGAATSMTALDARIKATKASVRELGLEFARTGDAMDGKAFAREKSLLSQLERLKKTLEPAAPASSSWLDKKINLPFAPPVSGTAVAAGAGAVAALAPVIAGVISAAVLGAVGAGGVVGGAFLAARDERVKAAWSQLGAQLIGELEPVGDAFVGPMVRSAEIFGKAFDESGIVDTLKEASVLAEPLANAGAGFVRDLGPGLRDAVRGSEPVIRVLARELPDLAKSISLMLNSMASVGPQAAAAMKDTFDVIEIGTEGLGELLAGLTEIYALTRQPFLKQIFDVVPMFGLIGALGKLSHKDLPDLGTAEDAADDAARRAASGIERYTDAAWAATLSTEDLFQNLTKVYHGFLELEDTEIAAEAAIDDLSDSLDKNGLNFDKNTEAGRENVTGLIQVARTAEDAIRTMGAQGKSVDEMRAAYDHYRQELFDTAIQAGATAEEAQALVDKWLAVKNLEDIIKSVTIQVSIVQMHHIDEYLAGNIPHGFQVYADGGYVQGPPGSPQMAIVHGGELILNQEQQQQARQWGGSTTWGGSDRTITVIVKDTSGRTLRTEMITDALNRNVPEATVRAAFP